ncbi:hypothetical protein J6590_022744 [Homalodisca vitripennis]|nr:hypothetical protein J6590_022744 [Homalodisca vitripennis]
MRKHQLQCNDWTFYNFAARGTRPRPPPSCGSEYSDHRQYPKLRYSNTDRWAINSVQRCFRNALKVLCINLSKDPIPNLKPFPRQRVQTSVYGNVRRTMHYCLHSKFREILNFLCVNKVFINKEY